MDASNLTLTKKTKSKLIKDEKIKHEVKKAKKKKKKPKVSDNEEQKEIQSESSELEEVSTARSDVPLTENKSIAIQQQSRPPSPSTLNHIILLMLNNWRSLSICSRISTLFQPLICMLLLIGWSWLLSDAQNGRNQDSSSRSFSPPADLSRHSSIKALHVYPDTHFTRKFTQEMLTVNAGNMEGLDFIFYSTLEALMNKLQNADIELLAIQLPKDWNVAGAFDYKIIPSPRVNHAYGKEFCLINCPSYQQEDYLKSGLLAVQSSVDLTALRWKGLSEGRSGNSLGRFDLKIRKMEEGRRFYEHYRDVHDLVYVMTILLSIVPFVELFYKLLVLVVQEKAGVKNLLKMMGVSETAYWLSKFLYYGIFVVYYTIFITISLKIILFRKTNTSIVFVLFLLFGISCLALAYFLSAFFSSLKFTFMIYIAIYVLIIFELIKTFSRKYNVLIALNTIRRRFFFININAALASLYASFLPDQVYDRSRLRKELPLDWGDVQPHSDPDLTETLDNIFGRELNEDRVFYGLIFFPIDVIIYLLLGFYLNNVIPDKLGIRQSPIFLCLPSYWGLKKKSRINEIADSSTTIMNENFEPVPPSMFGAPAISIRNLRKNYSLCPVGRPIPDALKGISLDIYAGQVTAILGKNGAGKSTLFHILIGLISPTSGTTYIFGYNSSNPADLAKIRRMVGVCLQEDVHFDHLTVLEHMQFFGKLRGFDGYFLDREVSQLIRDLHMEEKVNDLANQLSGGQKRRLSVGLAFIGNPPIIFLDEPSAGLDPVARRDLWSLLQSRREGKVILLTTHFMDEADILADRKAIMYDGIVRCMGSSLFLKNRLGAGYQLTVELMSASVDTVPIDKIIASYSPHASSSRKKIASELKYSFTFSEASNFSSLFAQLESELGKSIKNLGIATTSLEEVFLKVCRDDVVNVGVEETQSQQVDEQVDLLGDLGVLKVDFLSSLWAMIVIRLLRLFRSPFYFIAVFIFPMVIVILVSFINFKELPRYKPISRASLRISDHKGARVAVYNNGDNSMGITQFLQGQGISVKTYGGDPKDWRKLEDPNEYMAALNVQMDKKTGALEGDVWLNDQVPHAAPMSLDLVFKFYAQNVKEQSGRSVEVNTEYNSVSRQGYGYRRPDREVTLTEFSLYFLIPFVLGLTYSAPLAELVYENEKQLRTHLRVNGLSPLIYYLSIFIVYFSLTFIEYLLLAAFTWICSALPLSDPHSFFILFVLTTLHIVESLLFVFLLSLLMRKTKIAHALYFPLYLLVISVISLVLYALRKREEVYEELNYPHDENVPKLWYYIFCLLFTTYIPFGFYNGVGSAWESVPRYEPVSFSAYIVYQVIGALIIMIFHIVLYLGLLTLINMGSVRGACRLESPAPPLNSQQQIDEDVMAEGARIAEIFPSVGRNSDCVLIAKELRKSYGSKQILHGVSLLVEKGQVLGLLGHNGAGKTTTLRIITAEEDADSGQVKLGGYQIPQDSNVAFRELGFCPQHDALWENIRVTEHLNLYSVIHGVPGSQRKLLAFRILDGLSVREHERKYSQNLSGGTKRKLSYAISMASAPQIVLMDEPSTGMDPQSKRFLWNTVLGSFKENRGAVLTTHAMEEADVLSSKIVIMAKGALLCVGSPQHLKSKFGRSYTLEIKLVESFGEATNNVKSVQPSVRNVNVEGTQSPAPSDNAEGVTPSTQFDFVFENFPSSSLVEQFGNRAVFSIPIESSRPLSATFALLEKLKVAHGVQEYAYTQTTLEQVYLTVDAKKTLQ